MVKASQQTQPRPKETQEERKAQEKHKKTNLQLLPLQNRNLPQRPIPLPNPLPAQPDRPYLLVLPQRHREQRAIGRNDQVQRRVADLVEEDFTPLLVAEARLRVVELQRVGLQLLLPFGGLLGGGGRVVRVDVPD